ncbi:hypothetical protein AX16_000856 [Volvariella volvacea WC 439]|nr:hypothetical protein AX16_000856 [Volvariella volvacea WC 439]
MTLLTYPLARSGIHINNDHLEVAATTSSTDDYNSTTSTGSPPQAPPFTAAAPAVILVTQTTTTTPDSPPYQPWKTPPMSPPMTPRLETTNTIPPRHRTSPHLSVDSHSIEQITQTRSPSPPSLRRTRWTKGPTRSTSRSSTCASDAIENASISSTGNEFTPTMSDESFVDNDLFLINGQPRCHQGHPHSPTPSGEPPVIYPASTSMTTKLPGGATARQTNGILVLKDYLKPPDYSEIAGPEDSKLEQHSSESSGG